MSQAQASAGCSAGNVNQAGKGVVGAVRCIQGSIAQLSQQDLENIFGKSQWGLDLADTLNMYVRAAICQ